MADSNAVGGLKWVEDEIVASLQRVRAWLVELVERDGGPSQLNDAVTALSEVRALLSGLQMIGPARLTEEMQILCEDLQAESLPNRDEVVEALMLALIQLPDYLDKLGAGQADIPMALLPSINDLRGSKGAAPLSEAELLVPASVLAESDIPAEDVRRSLGRIATKVRPHFHQYLLQWLRDDTSRQGLVGLGRLFHRLQRHIGAGVFHELFLVAEAVAEASLDGSIASDTRTKALIAHLDRVLKSFAADPGAWPEEDAQSQLFDLLTLIAHSESASYRVQELRFAYGLEQAVDGGEPVPAFLDTAPVPVALGDLSLNEESPPGEADTRAQRACAPDSDSIAEVRRDVDALTEVPMPSSSQSVDEMPPADNEPDAEDVESPTPIAPITRIDPELLDVFVEEAEVQEQTIRHQFARWRDDEDDELALTTLRHAFHILKGSGRLVGAHRVGELARAVEMLLDRAIDGTLGASTAVIAFMEDAVALLPDLITAEVREQPLEVAELVARAESLALATPGETEVTELCDPEPRAAKVIPWPASARARTEDLASASDAFEGEAAAEAEAAAEIVVLAEADDELLDIFRLEAREHLEVLREYCARGQAGVGPAVPDESILRALHTLTGSARMTGVLSMARVTAPLERLFRDHQARDAAPNASLLAVLARAIEALDIRLTHMPGYGDEMATLRDLAVDLEERLAVRGAAAAIPATEEPGESPQKAFLAPGSWQEPDSKDDVRAPEIPGEVASEEATLVVEATGDMDAEEEDLSAEAVEDIDPDEESFSGEADAIAAQEGVPLQQDQELTTLFLEDARNIGERLDRSLRDLQLAPTRTGPLEEMQRSLHTLKGSARLSGLAPIGDLSHAFESLLTAITKGKARVDDDTLELTQRTLDTLSDQIDAVERRAEPPPADDLVQALSLVLPEGMAGEPGMVSDVAVIAPTPAMTGEIGEERAGLIDDGKPGAGAAAEVATPQLRVQSDLLNRLVDDVGEISIYRSRLSRQGALVSLRLGELDRTVDRLRIQLRDLESETEAQIEHSCERDADTPAPGPASFDPLEMDRFSTLQQLSRSLAETVNDLGSLRTLLQDLQGESDTLLQQQARITEDLQDGLLRTRMVPFAQAVPRLHRVVRQTARQLGKEARLEVFGPEVELDRSVQERMLAPLEHLLRNAVAHGIELPEERARSGKPATGVVSLMLNREGNDVVISVADDGAGLDLDAIRRRAVDSGLIAESAETGEQELSGLILEAGFSTVEEVSQIAGRGVGLDVVNAEVRQLSGVLGLESRPGRGTSFTIRLPLTLAIIEALLVRVGDQIFAIPHATIEAASRIGRAELQACYQGMGGDFSYTGQDYRVMYLGSMLQFTGLPDLGDRRWLPVLLARSDDKRIAFHVDQLLGPQRVVVKPLGPELSSIHWLSGGTILPDGRVAMILDLPALVRSAAVQDYRPPMQMQPEEQKRRPCVLVVDDSLTVRRVTSRMLRRQNMDAITATDGIDALTRLEERVPDAILLDIEMPRMDGYELVRRIRGSERFKKIPLIMITSRTGEKHRRHAFALGVDRYLGKPCQEVDLLDEISSVLGDAPL